MLIETGTDSAAGRAIFRPVPEYLLSLAQLYAFFQLLLRNGNRGSSNLFVVYEYAALLHRPPGLVIRAGQAAGSHPVQNVDFPAGSFPAGISVVGILVLSPAPANGLIRLLKIVGVVRNIALLILRIIDKSTIFRIIIISGFAGVCFP